MNVPESWQGGGSSGKDRSGPSAVCVLHLLLHFLCFSSLLCALDLTVLGRLVTLNCIHITYHLAQPWFFLTSKQRNAKHKKTRNGWSRCGEDFSEHCWRVLDGPLCRQKCTHEKLEKYKWWEERAGGRRGQASGAPRALRWRSFSSECIAVALKVQLCVGGQMQAGL